MRHCSDKHNKYGRICGTFTRNVEYESDGNKHLDIFVVVTHTEGQHRTKMLRRCFELKVNEVTESLTQILS